MRRNYYWLGRMALFAHAAVRFGVVDDALALLADALGRHDDAGRHHTDADAVRATVATHLASAGFTPRSPSPGGGTAA